MRPLFKAFRAFSRTLFRPQPRRVSYRAQRRTRAEREAFEATTAALREFRAQQREVELSGYFAVANALFADERGQG